MFRKTAVEEIRTDVLIERLEPLHLETLKTEGSTYH